VSSRLPFSSSIKPSAEAAYRKIFPSYLIPTHQKSTHKILPFTEAQDTPHTSKQQISDLHTSFPMSQPQDANSCSKQHQSIIGITPDNRQRHTLAGMETSGQISEDNAHDLLHDEGRFRKSPASWLTSTTIVPLHEPICVGNRLTTLERLLIMSSG
jgi:hypothetical protein